MLKPTITATEKSVHTWCQADTQKQNKLSFGAVLTYINKGFETLIHGPAPTRKIGFITVIFPVEESARAKLLSNVEKKMIINVMYQLLKALTTGAPVNGG